MFEVFKRAAARRWAVRVEAAELVELFGSEGAEIAALRARGDGLSEEQRRYWLAVEAVARQWQEHLAERDRRTG